MSDQDFHKTLNELTERKKKPSESDEEEKFVIPLRELSNLGGSTSQGLEDTERVAKIHNEAIHCDMEFDITQLLGKISVRPLADLKEIPTEVLADVNGGEFGEEEAKYDKYDEEKENLENSYERSRKFLKLSKSASEGLDDIVKAANREKQCNSHTASLSNNDTDPSTDNFSLFKNSATEATSSPLEKFLE